ncbi:carbohydrate ABC transporter substrate-binding protein [Oceanispirochaeta crateris]|uniref:Carbohydrate ABC transporter substrate-binding protein n=1 Tax=Oceanispirochaeta crateris TaxID=2518645 RepID=A0A5C1QIG6_9SPIO|nr:ABC transporter substrate-binding protein [Oceanispirochaeta crateris]QEN06939.1 carbohydrate ABC transporter substrate-binding protein [Oceanispirochaeta crateris]
MNHRLTRRFLLLFQALPYFVFPGGSQDETITLKETIVYHTEMTDSLSREADEEIIKRFSQNHPGIEVLYSSNTLTEAGKSDAAFKSFPSDLVHLPGGHRVYSLVEAGKVMDISEIWEHQVWYDSYAPSWQDMSSLEGKQYLIPGSWYWWALYYKPSVFERFSLEVPVLWEDFLSLCETLVDQGITPFAIGTKYPWTGAAWFDYFNMRINGPEFHRDLMRGNAAYDDPRVKKVFQEWGSMIDKGYFIDHSASYSWFEVIPSLLEEKTAMCLMGNFILDAIPAENREDVDFFRFPLYNTEKAIGEVVPSEVFLIPAESKHKDGASDLIAHFGSTDIQDYIAGKTGRLSANRLVDSSLYKLQEQKGIQMVNSSDFIFQSYEYETSAEMAQWGMEAFQEIWEHHSESDINRICSSLEKMRQSSDLIH